MLQNSIRPGHPFGYLDTELLLGDGTQLLIGFGVDAQRCDAADTAAVQRCLDEILPGYEVLAATARDWLADEFAGGTWAIHRPGWYTHHHAQMQRPEGRLVLAGSDLADGGRGSSTARSNRVSVRARSRRRSPERDTPRSGEVSPNG